MNCGVGHRHSLGLVLLWLWCRPAATALIRPLAWEFPCATGVALENAKRQQQQQQQQQKHVVFIAFLVIRQLSVYIYILNSYYLDFLFLFLKTKIVPEVF